MAEDTSISQPCMVWEEGGGGIDKCMIEVIVTLRFF